MRDRKRLLEIGEAIVALNAIEITDNYLIDATDWVQRLESFDYPPVNHACREIRAAIGKMKQHGYPEKEDIQRVIDLKTDDALEIIIRDTFKTYDQGD